MKINLIEYFVETVGRFGERVAVVDGGRCVIYGENLSKALFLGEIKNEKREKNHEGALACMYCNIL